jgi:nicotinate-nucleotide--dimethylbenzimidazole phosphoribosyltransferase
MSLQPALIAPTSNPLLEKSLAEKLRRRNESAGSMGELEPLAVRLGLMQNSPRPRFRDPQLVLFAADHGVAVDSIHPGPHMSTTELVTSVLHERTPLTGFARQAQVNCTLVDCGLAAAAQTHERLWVRRIAHGTRNARVTSSMSVEQAQAALRVGMEIGDALRGNVVMCAGMGVGAHLSAALVMAQLTDQPLRELLSSGPEMNVDQLAHQLVVARGAQGRHKGVSEPVEVLAAVGGFEVAVMVGVMLVAASKRHLIMVDGMPACAALMVAQRMAPPVTDYSLFCRSHLHQGLDYAMHLFRASAMLELGLNTLDGTGALLAWPLVKSAAALLADIPEADEAASTQPSASQPPISVPAAL